MPKKDAAKIGEITLGVDQKLNDVFGPYTSLGVSIGLRFDGDIDQFEAELDKFTMRAAAKAKQIMNEIAVKSGAKEPWAPGTGG